jgi:hypothetical protein
VTLVPPVFVTASDRLCVPPTATLPNGRLVGFATSAPADALPVAVNEMFSVGFDAFDVMATLPLTAPGAVGVNNTLKLALWPAVRVTGALIPLTLNPVPLTPTWEIVTVDPPVLVTVSESVLLLLTGTLPKARLVGFDPIAPAATPVPVNGIFSIGFDAVEVMVTSPLTAPATVGVNSTLKVALCPAARVTGALIPLTLNPDPLAPTCEIVMLDPPVFVTVSERVLLFPTWMLPKSRLVGFDPRVPAAMPVPDIDMVKVGFDPLDVIVRLPLTAPVAGGWNDTLNVALWPPARVTGAVMPLVPNPRPLVIATCDIVTLDPPVFVTVSEIVLFTPTCTFPNVKLAGFAVSGPDEAPVPDSGMFSVGFDPFDVMVTLPVTAPGAFGWNETVKLALCPPVKVNGAVNPLVLNPDPPDSAT